MNRLILPVFLILFSFRSPAQKIIYSDLINEDNREINFEILGKVADNYIIYKNVRWKHMLAVYDENMKLKDNSRIAFIPDKTFNIDFIIYPDHFYMVYQYQKRNTIYCKAVKMSSAGKKLEEPVVLDTSRVGLIADRKIYNTVFSEDKKRILVYKMQKKNDRLTIVTKLYDPALKMLDSTRMVVPFDERTDDYSDLFVDNNGTFLFAKERKTGWQDNVAGLEMIIRHPNRDTSSIFDIPLQGKFIDEVKIRIDNLNNNYIINSLFNKKKNGNIDGLFTSVIKKDGFRYKTAFNFFDDSLRARINSSGQYSSAFNNLFLRSTVVKKDGGFVIAAEDYYTQTSNTNFRRYNNLYRAPYTSSYDYYLSNPSYSGYYRPYGSSSYISSTRFYYDDILVLGIDSSLKLSWNSLIHKKQAEDEQDNFLSYATINAGAEIHFLFIDNNKNQVINNHSILPNGTMKRYATLKSYEVGFEFMPKLAKQVGSRQVIIPCVYRGSIAFAKVDFSE
jgi:hypothetical protein